MEEPGFWNDPERSTKTVREAKNLKDTVDGYKHLEQQYEDIQVMFEMGYEENDPAMIPEIQEMLDEFVKELEELRTKSDYTVARPGAYPTHTRALRNMRCHGESSGQSAGAQLKLARRKVRSGCGIKMVARPSRLLTPAIPSGEPLGLAG